MSWKGSNGSNGSLFCLSFTHYPLLSHSSPLDKCWTWGLRLFELLMPHNLCQMFLWLLHILQCPIHFCHYECLIKDQWCFICVSMLWLLRAFKFQVGKFSILFTAVFPRHWNSNSVWLRISTQIFIKEINFWKPSFQIPNNYHKTRSWRLFIFMSSLIISEKLLYLCITLLF